MATYEKNTVLRCQLHTTQVTAIVRRMVGDLIRVQLGDGKKINIRQDAVLEVLKEEFKPLPTPIKKGSKKDVDAKLLDDAVKTGVDQGNRRRRRNPLEALGYEMVRETVIDINEPITSPVNATLTKHTIIRLQKGKTTTVFNVKVGATKTKEALLVWERSNHTEQRKKAANVTTERLNIGHVIGRFNGESFLPINGTSLLDVLADVLSK